MGDCGRLNIEIGTSSASTVAPAVDLDVLIAGITDENRHTEVDFGGAVGNEKP
jgi:hypothetical protein